MTNRTEERDATTASMPGKRECAFDFCPSGRSKGVFSASATSLALKRGRRNGALIFTGTGAADEPMTTPLCAAAAKLGYSPISIEACAPGAEFAKRLPLLKKAGVSAVVFCVLSADKRSYDGLAGFEGAFDAFKQSAKAASAAGIETSGRFYLTADNSRKIKAFFKLAQTLGFSYAEIVCPSPFAAQNADALPSIDALKSAMDELFAHKPKIPFRVKRLPASLTLLYSGKPEVAAPDARESEAAITALPADGGTPKCAGDKTCKLCWLSPVCESARGTGKREPAATHGITANILLTSDCPNDCLFCTFKNVDPPGAEYFHTSMDEIEAQLEKGRKLGANRALFVGTEPLEYENLPAIVQTARALGYDEAEIQTHGEKFASAAFCKTMKKAGLTGVRMGIYGHNARLHDAVTQTAGSFARVVKAIDNLKKIGTPPRVHMTICRLNSKNIIDVEKFLAEKSLQLDEYKLVAPFTFDAARCREVSLSYSEVLADVAAQYKKLPPRSRLAEKLALKFSNTMIIPQCVILRARKTLNAPFTADKTSDASGSHSLERLQASVANLDSKGRASDKFLSGSKHDIKTTIICPSAAECAFGKVCPGIYLLYAKAWGLDEFIPVSETELSEHD